MSTKDNTKINVNKTINPKIKKFFSALADDTRLKIVTMLYEKPMTVNEIHRHFDNKITLSCVSHQLKMLNDLDIVSFEKKGREKYYRLSTEFCWCILKDAFNHFDSKTKCKKCCKNY